MDALKQSSESAAIVSSKYLTFLQQPMIGFPFFVGIGGTTEVFKSKPILITVDGLTFKYNMELDASSTADGADDEDTLWESLEEIFHTLLTLLDEYENTVFGATPTQCHPLFLACGCFRWMKEARDLLYEKNWGDIDRCISCLYVRIFLYNHFDHIN